MTDTQSSSDRAGLRRDHLTSHRFDNGLFLVGWIFTDLTAGVERLERELCSDPAQPPMQADIAQIIDAGWKNGKSATEVAAELLSEAQPTQGGDKGEADDGGDVQMLLAQLIVTDNVFVDGAVFVPEQTLPASVYDKALAAANRLAAPQPEAAYLRKGIQDFLDGNYENPRKHRGDGPAETCGHGLFYWQDCGDCDHDHFTRLLAQPASNAGSVIDWKAEVERLNRMIVRLEADAAAYSAPDSAEIIQGVRDAAAFCDCSTHPDAAQWAGCCRVAAARLRGNNLPPSPHVEYVASRGQSKVEYWVTREEGDRIRAAALSSTDREGK